MVELLLRPRERVSGMEKELASQADKIQFLEDNWKTNVRSWWVHSGQLAHQTLRQRRFEPVFPEPEGFCGFESCVSRGQTTQL